MNKLICPQYEILECNNTYSNSDLWVMAERGMLEKNTIIEDLENNQLIFTGFSFQVFDTKENEEITYVGMTIGDEWKIVGVYDETTNSIKK